ncbi:hypothetical protein [Corynebacterium sp. Marseille-P8863]|uniref:hypothetical protein n=1 Tax=Corynebacterium sp. Marseille-P8863 TaxID=2866576 RepID=UPI0022642FEE|nr:hypothetical protein [Corynebacterium sp. Marseille-P8863]
MNVIARKALAATCALAVMVPAFRVPAEAKVVDDPSVVTVTADEVGPFFHNVELDKGRISSFKFTDPASVGGTRDSSFYIDFRFGGQKLEMSGANTKVQTRKDGKADVITMRNEDRNLGVQFTREFRIDGNTATVRTEITNTSGSDSYYQLDMTNQINTARELQGSYEDGRFTVGPESLGYDTEISFDGATYSGAASSFNGTTNPDEVGFVDESGAQFQRGRWFDDIAAGQTVVAETTMTMRTQDGAEDTDGDGLANAWEEQGLTLNDGTELPLNAWGADPNRPDIFLQMNWMPSEYESLGCFDNPQQAACADANTKSYRPSNDILQQLVDLFADHDVNLHIDAGESYTNIPNYSERHGGVYGDYTKYYFQNEPQGVKLMDNIDEMLGDRSAVFRSGMVGDQMDPSTYSVGVSTVGDNAFYVANHDRMTTDEQFRNTILHELGHTLGLDHNGSTKFANQVPDSDYLPNYYSVMNYLYQFSHFDYSDHESVSGGELPQECYNPGANCYTGDYRVPADWDNLIINTGHIGKPVGTVGVKSTKVDAAAAKTAAKYQQDLTKAEKNEGTVDVEVASSNLEAGKAGKVTLKVNNRGADLNRYTVQVVTPHGDASKDIVLDGALTDRDEATVTVPVTAGDAAIMPLDVKVTNQNGETAFEDRFAVDVKAGKASANPAAMAGATNAPAKTTKTAKSQEAATETVTANPTVEAAPSKAAPAKSAPAKSKESTKNDDGAMTTVASPKTQDQPEKKELHTASDDSRTEGGPNIAAIIVPIIAILAIIGGAAAALGSGVLG